MPQPVLDFCRRLGSSFRKAILLDRDGVLIGEGNHLKNPAEVRLLPGVTEALKSAQCETTFIAVISNQPGVARGKTTLNHVKAVNHEIRRQLELGGVLLDAFIFCPHDPAGLIPEFTGSCPCRKPATGMFDELKRVYRFSGLPFYFIGDDADDVEFAVRIGAKAMLVRTGSGAAEEPKVKLKWGRSVVIADDLKAALEWMKVG